MKRLCLLAAMFSTANFVFADARLIIKYKPTIEEQASFSKDSLNARVKVQPLTKSKLMNLSALVGAKVTELRPMATGAHVVIINKKDISPQQLADIIKRISQDKRVDYVEEDKIVKPTAIPALNPQQWDMQNQFDSSIYPSWVGNNFIGAWNILSGMGLDPGNGVVVAVLDSGYTPHPNFINNLQSLIPGSNQYGYQFISDCRKAGSCPANTSSSAAALPPQPDALDLGDYVSQNDISTSNGYFPEDCLQLTSNWHGTHVTGTIIAQGYSGGSGVLGGAYAAKVVPVRVLGKCGGYTSDLVDGMMWSAGLGTIANSYPAQILNMSLRSPGDCSNAEQDAIDQITAGNKIIVAAAGNDSKNVSTASPANCRNVIRVAANGPTLALAGYSNWGATTLTAAGGDTKVAGCAQDGICPSAIYSTIWNSPSQFDLNSGGGYNFNQGTSMAAPHVSAAVANIITVLNNNGENYSLAKISQILQNTAMYSYQNCNNAGCVASGLLSAENAVSYAATNYSQILLPNMEYLEFMVGGPLTRTVTFANPNNNPVIVSSVRLSGNSQSRITSNTCNNASLNLGQSCSVTVSWSGSTTQTGVLQLINASGTVISTVNISSGVSNSPSPSTTGGGGCSMVQGGDDVSLLLIMGIGTLIYGYRRYKGYYKFSITDNRYN